MSEKQEEKKKKKKTGPKTKAGKLAVSKNLDPTGWMKNPEAVEALNIARRLRKTTHGLYASVPIICKAEGCPYAESCELQQMGIAPYGEKCPIEIAAMEDLFSKYCKELGIDPMDETQTVDAMQVRDLVDTDIQILRCDHKLAIDADIIIENVIGVTEKKEPVTRKELHPVTEYKDKLINRRNKILQMLNATRKDKAGNVLQLKVDPSERAAEMMNVINDMKDIEEEESRREQDFLKRYNGVVIDVDSIEYEEEPNTDEEGN